jgi:hypothetical protein
LQCDPYFDQVGCKHPGCEPAYPTPVCEKKCKVQNQVWEEKKHFSVNAYRINSDPDDIMSEVYENGPVEVAFTVYEVMSSLCLKFSVYYNEVVNKFCPAVVIKDYGVYYFERTNIKCKNLERLSK